MKPSEYIDLVKNKIGAKNDNELSVKINWRASKTNNYRHNRQLMDNEAARQVAEILEMPVIAIIADMEAQRAKDKEAKKEWIKLAKMTAQRGFASTNLLLILSFFSWTFQNCILC